MKPVREHFQVIGLAGLVLVIFSPALYAPLNPMDDRAIVQWLYGVESMAAGDLFAFTTGNYYRPILQLTYLLDMKLWGAEPSFMHLMNLLLHISNVVLVFLCARVVCRRYFPLHLWIPLVAALFFAIHPINTEAVNWIAGRSDLLACFFVLLALFFLLYGLAKDKAVYAYLSIFALVPGFFSKETALFFVPAAVIIILFETKIQALSVAKRKLQFLAPFVVLPLLYLIMRSVFVLSRDSGFGLLKGYLTNNQFALVDTIEKSLVGAGFYLKKLLFPWPLNFTIYQVSEGYLWLGLLLVVLIIYVVFHRGLAEGFFLASCCIGLSAVLALLMRPAWTPLAERYLYIPSTFFCMALVFLGGRFVSRGPSPKWLALGLSLLFSAMAYTTVQRNLIWQNNIDLFQDAVNKEPDFPFSRTVLAGLLIEAGRKEEGKAMIRNNRAPEGLRNASFLELKRAQLLLNDGDAASARELILKYRHQDSQLYYLFQQLLIKVNEVLLKTLGDSLPQDIRDELIALYLELYEAHRDPFYYYRLAQFYMREQEREHAARYFRLAYQGAPEGAHYKEAARVLAERLSAP